jgi:hypothetical protein
MARLQDTEALPENVADKFLIPANVLVLVLANYRFMTPIGVNPQKELPCESALRIKDIASAARRARYWFRPPRHV